MKNLVRLLIVFVLCFPLVGTQIASAQTAADKTRAIAHCVDLIRQCQLTDGAFRVKAEGTPALIIPYFSNLAALALLANGDSDDLPRVAEWLEWYARHQLDDGSINNFDGTVENHSDRHTRDSVDSYAATYLLVVARYYSVTGTLPAGVANAAVKALGAIKSVTDSDGLTWAKTTPEIPAANRFKFVQDNIEVYGSLVKASEFFVASGDSTSADQAKAMFEKMGTQLPTYLRTAPAGLSQATGDKAFAYVKDVSGNFQFKDDIYPSRYLETGGMANLTGLAWISDTDKTPWKQLNGYKPDRGICCGINDPSPPAPQAPVERWYIGALHGASSSELADLSQQLVEQANAFVFDGFTAIQKSNDVYIHRPAIAALAMLEGSDWLPGLKAPASNSTPIFAITTPTNNQILTPNSFANITGTATSNANLSQVSLTLSRTRNGATQYWNGSAFSPTASDLSTILAANNSTNTDWSYPVSAALKAALDEGAYLIRAYAKDAAGNQSPIVERTFTLFTNVAPILLKMSGPSGDAATVSGSPGTVSPLLTGQSAADSFVTFTTTVRDANGNDDLSDVTFILGSNASELRLGYDAVTNLLSVSGTTGSFSPASPNVLNTASGALDCATTTVTRNGGDLTIAWRLKINATSTLKQGLRLLAQDKAGARSPVLSFGNWSFTSVSNVAPTLAKMIGPGGAAATASGTPVIASPPLAGQSAADQFVPFTTIVSDANGNADLGVITFILGSNATELRLTYDAAKNRLSVSGASGSFVPGRAGVLTTPSGSLDCGASTVTRNGNDLAITWALKINTSATLKQGLRLQVQDKAGARSTALSFGNWTFSSTSNLAPTLVSTAGPDGIAATVSGTPPVVSPLLNGQSPVGSFVPFTTTVRDGNGNADLGSIFFILGSGAKELRLTYNAVTDRLSAPGGSSGSFAPGSANTLTTPGGVLDCAATTVVRNGNDLSITWRLKVTSVVKQGVRLQVQDKSNVRSPVLSFGSWTFTGNTASALTAPSGDSS